VTGPRFFLALPAQLFRSSANLWSVRATALCTFHIPFFSQASTRSIRRAQLQSLPLTCLIGSPPSVPRPHAYALHLAAYLSPSPLFLFDQPRPINSWLIHILLLFDQPLPSIIQRPSQSGSTFVAYYLPLQNCRPSIILSPSTAISTATQKVQNRGHQIIATRDQGSAGNHSKARGNSS